MRHAGQISASGGGPVEAALADYFERLDRGEHIELAALIAAHPGCEAGVRQFLQHQRPLHALTAATRLGATQLAPTLGDFRLIGELGRGGMGVVYEAQQLSLGRRVALKVLSRPADADALSRARFRNETDVLARLRHPHIVDVFVVGEDAGACYYAMELIAGGNANALIDDAARLAPPDRRGADAHESSTRSLADDGTAPRLAGSSSAIGAAMLPLEGSRPGDRCRFVATIARQVADALSHAHAGGVLHRDVKPSNILLDQRGCAYLSDFGLARIRGQETLTAWGDVVGTLRYAAPEIVQKTASRADERSDVYSLGASLWEMLAGRRLFDGGERGSLVRRILEEPPEAPSRGRPDIPKDLETIALCALAKEPARRYQSADLMRDDLDRFLAGRPIAARRTGITERALLWALRNRRLASTLAAATVLLACVATLSALLIARAERETTAALATSRRSEATARQQSAAATASELAVRRMLYSTDMALAGAAWKAGETGHARMLLDRHSAGDASAPEAPADHRGFEWRFLDCQLQPRSEVLYRGDDALYALVQAPDGRHFVTAGRDSIVRWHDLATGRVTRSISADQAEVNGLGFSPSGKFFVTAGDDGTVKVWSAEDLSLRRTIPALADKVFYAAFLDDDDHVVCGGNDTNQVLIDVTTGTIVQRLIGPALPPKPESRSAVTIDGCFIPSRRRLLTTRETRHVRGADGVELWNLENGARREILSLNAPLCVRCDADGRLAYIASRTELHVVDLQSGEALWSTPLTNTGGPLALSPDGRRLVMGAPTGELFVWNIAREARAVALTLGGRMPVHDSQVIDVDFERDGVAVLSVGRDGAVRRTNVVDRPALYHELVWARRDVLTPIPDSNLVLTRRPLAIRDGRTGRIVRRFDDQAPLAYALSGDGQFVAAATDDGNLRVWNCRNGQLMLDHAGPREKLFGCSLSFAGAQPHLAVNWQILESLEHRFEVIDLRSRRSIGPLAHNQTQWMFGCQEGGLVFREFDPRGVACLEIPSGRVRWRRPPFQDNAQYAAISRDGRWLVASDAERRAIMLFDCRTGDVKYRTPCSASAGALAVADDGLSFFVGDVDGAVSVWSLEYGQKLFDLAKFEAPIERLCSAGDAVFVAVYKIIDDRKVFCWYRF